MTQLQCEIAGYVTVVVGVAVLYWHPQLHRYDTMRKLSVD